MPKRQEEKPKKKARVLTFLSGVIVPVLYLFFIVMDRQDFWDKLRGLDAVKNMAAQMDTSYDPNVQRQFRPKDEGWQAALNLIKRYSTAQLPENKEPLVLARHVAVLSGKADLGGGKFAEWTAPSTPLYLLYSELPTKLEDSVQVGTLGDLHSWIEKSKTDFRFYVQELLLGVFSLVLGVLIWKREYFFMNRMLAS